MNQHYINLYIALSGGVLLGLGAIWKTSGLANLSVKLITLVLGVFGTAVTFVHLFGK